MKKAQLLLVTLLTVTVSPAQQFVGFPISSQLPSILQVPQNPSFIVKEQKGMEVNLFSASALGGTNAYGFSKDYFTEGLTAGAAEGEEYFKDYRGKKKHLWLNIDVLGPAVSLTYKETHNLGLYTRIRQVTRGGNLERREFLLIGDLDTFVHFPDSFRFEKAGFSTHIFGEVSFTYGKELSNDLYHIVRAGVTVKYLMGVAAGTLYTPATELVKHTADSTNLLKGELTALYSENFTTYVDNDPANDFASWGNRGGGGSLGFDLGIQYEYHPEGDPNRYTPYSYRIAASITDIGSIAYRADTGSGKYKVAIKDNADWQYQRREFEDFASYFGRLKKDSQVIQTDSSKSFRVGLPTAFRLNADMHITSNFWVGLNVLLNLKGDNGEVYRPAYVNMLNLTPRYEKGWFMIGVPFSFWGYQTYSMGVILRAGPFYLGSTSLISALLGDRIRYADGYAGLAFRFPKKLSTYTY
jgi:hypothetical protein